MSKIIAICDGHGLGTPGKRTPQFPDGTVMKENEFNNAVADILEEILNLSPYFEPIRVAPTDKDIPLKTRVELANEANADLYISIHANAFDGNFKAPNPRGIETYAYPGSELGEKYARIIHKHLLKGTTLPDRGVKFAEFYVLKHTKMPAVLVELGFMDNLEDAKLLKSDDYRAECAIELAKGIHEIFGVPYEVNDVITEEEFNVFMGVLEKILKKIILN